MATRRPFQMERALLREAASVAVGRLTALQKDETGEGGSNLIIIDLQGYIDHANQALKNLMAMQSRSSTVAQVFATKEKFLK